MEKRAACGAPEQYNLPAALEMLREDHQIISIPVEILQGRCLGVAGRLIEGTRGGILLQPGGLDNEQASALGAHRFFSGSQQLSPNATASDAGVDGDPVQVEGAVGQCPGSKAGEAA